MNAFARRFLFVPFALTMPAAAGAQERPVGPTATVSIETPRLVQLEVAPEPLPIEGRGTLTVRVEGLPAEGPRRILRIVNATPAVLSLDGGDEQEIVIEPWEVSARGEFVRMLGVTGRGRGNWRIRVLGPATAPPGTPLPAPPVVPPVVPPAVDPTPALDPPTTDRARLEVARGRWAESGPVNYEMTVERVCFCAPDWRGPVRVTVRDGQVVGRTYLDGNRPVATDRADLFPGVEGIFDFIGEALDENPARVEAEYDLRNGRPIRVWIDYDEMQADEERGYVTTDLAPGS